jgi:hypothetical protein
VSEGTALALESVDAAASFVTAFETAMEQDVVFVDLDAVASQNAAAHRELDCFAEGERALLALARPFVEARPVRDWPREPRKPRGGRFAERRPRRPRATRSGSSSGSG